MILGWVIRDRLSVDIPYSFSFDFTEFLDDCLDRLDSYIICESGCRHEKLADVDMDVEKEFNEVHLMDEFSKSLSDFKNALYDESNDLRIVELLTVLDEQFHENLIDMLWSRVF